MTSTPTAADRIIDAAASLEPGMASGVEQRKQKRYAYHSLVALVLADADGGRQPPVVLRAHDLSTGGLSVAGTRPIESGAEGVLQLVRCNGRFALVGVKVRHCRYMGAMEHRTGLQFIPLPAGFTREEFFDARGRMVLLDPLLRTNLGT